MPGRTGQKIIPRHLRQPKLTLNYERSGQKKNSKRVHIHRENEFSRFNRILTDIFSKLYFRLIGTREN